MKKDTYLVHFLIGGKEFQGKECRVAGGTRLSAVLAEQGIPISLECGGKGICGRCSVRVLELNSPDRNRQPVTGKEHGETGIGSLFQQTQAFHEVLSCQYRITSDLIVRLPDVPSREKTNVPSYPGKPQPVPVFPLYTSSDTELGIVVDLGTTTLIAAIIDLKTGTPLTTAQRWNPQAAFGRDVISRIQAIMENPNCQKRLQQMVVDTIEEMIQSMWDQLCSENRWDRDGTALSSSPAEKGLSLYVAGNTVMEYLFLGLNPESLGKSPFLVPVDHFEPFSGKSLGFNHFPNLTVYAAPVISAFVGGDTVAGLAALSSPLTGAAGPELFLDIGTNGEIVLIHQGKMLSTAAAAGPAFEGSEIQFGMLGEPGAVEHVDFASPDPIQVIGNGPVRGICGSGLVDLIAELLNYGILDRRGRFQVKSNLTTDRAPGIQAGPGPAELEQRVGIFEGKKAFRLTGTAELPELTSENREKREPEKNTPVWLTQGDVRQVQLAVGAIRAGITLLLQEAGLKPENLNKLYLAGGFGNYLSGKNAKRIGLFPPELETARIIYQGNTSLRGAIRLLQREHAGQPTATPHVEFLELATHPDFTRIFTESMIFPKGKE